MRYYSDGACSGNPGPGGYGWVLIHNGELCCQGAGYEKNTTNNRMELMAILSLLQYHDKYYKKYQSIVIYSDSAYCCNLISKWMYDWEKNNWQRPKNQIVKNLDIVKEIFSYAQTYDITMEKVAGHSGDYWNEYVDKMAVNALELAR